MHWVAAIFAWFCLAGSALAGPLLDAAKQGDTATVDALLNAGAVADERGQNAETPLIAAALAGNVDTAAALIKKGADVMARNRSGFTALHAAAYGGHADIVRLLLESGADLEDKLNRAGQTPIFMASDENRTAVVELLLAEGADVTTFDKSGFTVLIRALLRKRYEIAGLLKHQGATCPSPEMFGEDFHRQCVEVGP